MLINNKEDLTTNQIIEDNFVDEFKTTIFDFLSLKQKEKNQKKITEPRYVIYVRKSTDEIGKQVTSIEDQIRECQKYAKNNGLEVVGEPLIEKQSAKIAGMRPVFARMLGDIKKGKYDSIISWHPDRLSRNMKEAGEIIDFIDRGIINNLGFVSYTFEKSPSGIMTLGIMFAISKEYSDKLSLNIKRGSYSRFREGKWLGKPKMGYYKDNNQYLRPENEYGTFNLWTEAWMMRINGSSLADISNFLIEKQVSVPNGKYYLENGTKEPRMKPFKPSKQRLSDFFADPFYAGVAVYGEEIVKLDKVYDFVPMVTEKDFWKINKISKKEQKTFLQRHNNATAKKQFLLRNKVICGYCGKPLYRELTSKKKSNGSKNWYYYYRCQNKECRHKGESIRAKIIRDFVLSFLKENNFGKPELYKHYKDEIKQVNAARTIVLDGDINRFNGDIRVIKSNIAKINELLINSRNDSDLIVNFSNQLKETKKSLSEIEEKLKQAKKNKNNLQIGVISYEKYLELSQKMPHQFESIKTLAKLDWYIQKIFLNFIIKDGKILNYQLKEPFATWVENGLIRKCGL